MGENYAIPQLLKFDISNKRVDTLPPLIGREKEVEELSQLISSTAGPIVVAGPVGSGKSRLALEVAHTMRESFPQGVYVFDCVCDTDSKECLSRLARFSSGFSASSGTGSPQRGRLLVIDNYDAANETMTRALTEILSPAPDCSLMVTSREVIRLYEGHIFNVHPLPLPKTWEEVSEENAATSPSVELLAHRSGLFASHTELTETDRTALVELLHSLDGLPLAIEFAAPWLHVLEPSSLLRRLGKGLSMLNVSSGTVSLRHNSMREALESHYRALPSAAQKTLVQLSQHDEFTLDSALHIVDDTPERVDHLLRLLIDRNFLRIGQIPGNQPKLALLNTTRAFLRDRAEETRNRAQYSAAPPRSVDRGPAPRLTPRQSQVATLVAHGLTNREISKRLGIAEWTAINHVREVMRRLECSSRVQVANWVTENSNASGSPLTSPPL